MKASELVDALRRRGIDFDVKGLRLYAWGCLTDADHAALAACGPSILDLAGMPPPVRLTIRQSNPPDSRLAYLLAEFHGGPDRLRIRVVWADGTASTFWLPVLAARELRRALGRVLRESASTWGKPVAGTRSPPVRAAGTPPDREAG